MVLRGEWHRELMRWNHGDITQWWVGREHRYQGMFPQDNEVEKQGKIYQGKEGKKVSLLRENGRYKSSNVANKIA